LTENVLYPNLMTLLEYKLFASNYAT